MTDAREQEAESPRPARVRVTAPRAGAELPRPVTTTEASDPSALYIRSLIRSQRRLAIVCAAAFGVVLLVVPTAFALLPWLDETRIGPVPASWIVLGGGLFPVILAVAALYEHAANRNEARYRSLADDADDDG